MLKQIYIDDLTNEEIVSDVYQIELATVTGGDIELPLELEAMRAGMHFSLDSIERLFGIIKGEPTAEQIWMDRCLNLDIQGKELSERLGQEEHRAADLENRLKEKENMEARVKDLEAEVEALRSAKAEFGKPEESEAYKKLLELVEKLKARNAKLEEEKKSAVPEEIILVPADPDEECRYDDDSIKGIDEGRLKALYYAGWSNAKLGNEFKKSKKAISTKISLMIKSGKMTRRQDD